MKMRRHSKKRQEKPTVKGLICFAWICVGSVGNIDCKTQLGDPERRLAI